MYFLMPYSFSGFEFSLMTKPNLFYGVISIANICFYCFLINNGDMSCLQKFVFMASSKLFLSVKNIIWKFLDKTWKTA